MVEYQS